MSPVAQCDHVVRLIQTFRDKGDNRDIFRVRVGPFPSMATMESANRVLADMNIRALRLKVSRKP